MSNKLRKPPKSFGAMKAQMKVKNTPPTHTLGRPYSRTPVAPRPTGEAESEMDWGRSALSPGKGKKDGNCNRTACQAPLKGREQWYMRDYGTTDGRLYYCGRCARDFNNSDKQFNEPQRCTFDDETVIEKLSA